MNFDKVPKYDAGAEMLRTAALVTINILLDFFCMFNWILIGSYTFEIIGTSLFGDVSIRQENN